MVAVQRLEHLAVDDAAGLKAQLGDAPAGPDARRLAAPLRRRQVVADARRGLGACGWFGGADLLPRVGGIVALGDGDDPGHAPASSPPPAAARASRNHHDH